MSGLSMSPAAGGLLRALLARAAVGREQILVSAVRSVDWQSLTFSGERHLIALRVPGPGAAAAVARLIDKLGDAEFAIPGQIVADIVIDGPPEVDEQGAIIVTIEALTIAE